MHAMARHRIPQYSDDLFRTLQPLPTINGSIKTLPDEFVVDEILPFEPAGTGEHLYIEIEKTGANTGWVAYQLASFLEVRDLDVSYAGRKDRHGVTTQWFSCYLPTGTDVDWTLFSVEGVVVKSMTWHRSKLRRGQLQCNVFRIKVRHGKLTESQGRDLVERLEQSGRAWASELFWTAAVWPGWTQSDPRGSITAKRRASSRQPGNVDILRRARGCSTGSSQGILTG